MASTAPLVSRDGIVHNLPAHSVYLGNTATTTNESEMVRSASYSSLHSLNSIASIDSIGSDHSDHDGNNYYNPHGQRQQRDNFYQSRRYDHRGGPPRKNKRSGRSKHQPPAFNDESACKHCHTKQKDLKQIKKQKLNPKIYRKLTMPKNIDESHIPDLEFFGERWDVFELLQYLNFFDIDRFSKMQYYKIPRTHSEEIEFVNSHTLTEIFARQLGFRRPMIPKRFHPIPLHEICCCEARTTIREAIGSCMTPFARRLGGTQEFRDKFYNILCRYIGCIPLTKLCGATLPELWQSTVGSKNEEKTTEDENTHTVWTYYFLVTWDNYHLFMDSKTVKLNFRHSTQL